MPDSQCNFSEEGTCKILTATHRHEGNSRSPAGRRLYSLAAQTPAQAPPQVHSAQPKYHRPSRLSLPTPQHSLPCKTLSLARHEAHEARAHSVRRPAGHEEARSTRGGEAEIDRIREEQPRLPHLNGPSTGTFHAEQDRVRSRKTDPVVDRHSGRGGVWRVRPNNEATQVPEMPGISEKLMKIASGIHRNIPIS